MANIVSFSSRACDTRPLHPALRSGPWHPGGPSEPWDLPQPVSLCTGHRFPAGRAGGLSSLVPTVTWGPGLVLSSLPARACHCWGTLSPLRLGSRRSRGRTERTVRTVCVTGRPRVARGHAPGHADCPRRDDEKTTRPVGWPRKTFCCFLVLYLLSVKSRDCVIYSEIAIML